MNNSNLMASQKKFESPRANTSVFFIKPSSRKCKNLGLRVDYLLAQNLLVKSSGEIDTKNFSSF